MTAVSSSLSPVTTKNPLLEAALQYAALGLPVIPCHSPEPTGGCTCKKTRCPSPGKHPRNWKGTTNATTSATMIRKWWERWPDASVAIATAGLLVVDTDGPTAEMTIAGLDLPPSPTAITSKGKHRYFTDPAGTATNKKGIALPGVITPDQVDIRGTGGCVIAPPSLHASGKVYAWAPGLSPADLAAPPAPQWLYELRPPRSAPCRVTGGTAAPSAEGELFPEGTRNQSLFDLGRAWLSAGVAYSQVQSGLQTVNDTRCRPPLDADEVERIAAQATGYVNYDVVRMSKELLKGNLSSGSLALYTTRQALVLANGIAPREAAIAEALGVTKRTVRTWVAELRRAGLDGYKQPENAYVLAPVAMLVDPQVCHAAKTTALYLLTCANNGVATVSLQALVKMTGGRSESAIQRDLEALEKSGHLMREVFPFDAELGKRKQANIYTFLYLQETC